MLDTALNGQNMYHLEGAAQIISYYQLKKININVMFTYSDYLEGFGKWYLQLWSEKQ